LSLFKNTAFQKNYEMSYTLKKREKNTINISKLQLRYYRCSKKTSQRDISNNTKEDNQRDISKLQLIILIACLFFLIDQPFTLCNFPYN
jgi:hypothetical protein